MVFRIFILACFSILSSYSLNAQTIIVNGSSVSVANTDVTFPFWLDSGSTIEIGDHVISISALEFNIVPNNNGNSLVYVQTKLITTLETVPNGKTWKLEGVLLDSSINNNTTNSSQVNVSGGLSVIDLSDESPNTMTFGAALDYCDNLIEGGNEDWILPNYEDLMHAIGGGVSIASRNNNLIWTTTKYNDLSNHVNVTNTNGNEIRTKNVTDLFHVRCIRKGSVSVSSSQTTSNSSQSVSTSAFQPVAISNNSPNSLSFNDASSYCDSLLEDGYDNWVMPTIEDLMYAFTGGLGADRSDDVLWTRTPLNAGNNFTMPYEVYSLKFPTSGNVQLNNYSVVSSLSNVKCVRYGNVNVTLSNSSGSNTASSLGDGMPTMISNESANTMSWGESILYCDSLNESGHSDWIMPSTDQLTYAISGGCTISDTRTDEYIWTRTIDQGSSSGLVHVIALARYISTSNQTSRIYSDPSTTRKCRCVR